MTHTDTQEPLYRKNGARVMEPPCAQGHHTQAMECPDCYEALNPGEKAGDEWRAWHAKRYGRKAAPRG